MSTTTKALGLGILMLLLALPAAGQRRKGLPAYDPANETTFDATVEQVKNHRCGRNWTGAHLIIAYDGKPLEVHLGPAAFIKEQAISFQPGDKVTITGSRVRSEEEDSIVAREVRKGEQRLVLRTDDGKPAWSDARWQW